MGWVDRRLFHSDSVTVSQCDHFCCNMYFLFETLHDVTKLKRFFFCVWVVVWGGHSSPVYLYPRYTGFTLSVRLSVCPSVCRRHGFRSISQVCFGISISNFICMLMVAIGRSLLIFSVVTFKMAAWRPYWIFWFPDSNFSLALNIKFKLQGHNTYVYG